MPIHSSPATRPISVTTAADLADPPSERDRELVALVRAASAGDHAAWSALVRRFESPLRAIARSYRLASTDADDVIQTTWLNLLDDIGGLREPAAIAGWLVTTTRRNAMRRLQATVREQLTDDPRLGDRPDTDGPEAQLLAAERRDVLARALATLPDRHRQLMTVLATHPAPNYDHVSELLSMPRGSIGPIRARSLARLSRNPQLRALATTPPPVTAQSAVSTTPPIAPLSNRTSLPPAATPRRATQVSRTTPTDLTGVAAPSRIFSTAAAAMYPQNQGQAASPPSTQPWRPPPKPAPSTVHPKRPEEALDRTGDSRPATSLLVSKITKRE